MEDDKKAMICDAAVGLQKTAILGQQSQSQTQRRTFFSSEEEMHFQLECTKAKQPQNPQLRLELAVN